MNIAVGIRLDLSALPARDRRALRKLMARISESSYRRGFQQAVHMVKRGETDEDRANKLRWTLSLDVSPRGESFARGRGRPAVERFEMEFGTLRGVGLTGEPDRITPPWIVEIEGRTCR